MIPLNTVFWAFVALFGLVGALRGWAKEIMVVASVLLALFVSTVTGILSGLYPARKAARLDQVEALRAE